MGTVWAATHVVTKKPVAIKFLRPDVQHRDDVRQRFLREATAASALRHPNVVDVLDVFELEDHSPILVMELLEGETLGEKLVREERLSVEETAALLLPVLSAVGTAHAMGIVHRDLKPDNLFLARAAAGTLVKVLDFGIAKLAAEHYLELGQSVLLTEAGAFLGTPCYMAPEQLTNDGVDHRADIWSLGVILYECLSGTRPVEGRNLAEVISRLISGAITPLERLAPELPHDVTGIVQQMLVREVKNREPNLLELEKILTRYARVSLSPGIPISRAQPVSPTVEPQAAPVTRKGENQMALPRPNGAGTMLSVPAVHVDSRPNPTVGVGRARRVRPGWLLFGALLIGGLGLLIVHSLFQPSPGVATNVPGSAPAASPLLVSHVENTLPPQQSHELPASPPAVWAPTAPAVVHKNDSPDPSKVRAPAKAQSLRKSVPSPGHTAEKTQRSPGYEQQQPPPNAEPDESKIFKGRK